MKLNGFKLSCICSLQPERLDEEIRRRTRVAGLFPDETSASALVSAVLMEISDD